MKDIIIDKFDSIQSVGFTLGSEQRAKNWCDIKTELYFTKFGTFHHKFLEDDGDQYVANLNGLAEYIKNILNNEALIVVETIDFVLQGSDYTLNIQVI